MQRGAVGRSGGEGERDDVSGDRAVAVFAAGDDPREHEGRGGSLGVQSARAGGYLHRKQHAESAQRAGADRQKAGELREVGGVLAAEPAWEDRV